MRVLVIGSGGREHALCWALKKSKNLSKLFCAPGNGGISQLAKCVNITTDDIPAIVQFAISERIDFVIIGPEAPLVGGLSDQLEKVGISAFGPSAATAMIEGSKGLMKDLCKRYDIPTAKYARFDDSVAAKKYIQSQGTPIVVKADGLAAGKGVFVCHKNDEAYAAIDLIMTKGAFGKAGAEVVIEELLVGEEASFFALVDGEHALPMVAAQDHKTVFDGDTGPNTGGMGAYSPAPVIDGDMADTIMETIINPTVCGMAADAMPYKGVLFAGIMITSDGPKLIEYNCRFGDPECQTLMVRLESDLLEVLLATTKKRLNQIKLKWSEDVALTVVIAARGYPGNYERGSEIQGIADAEATGAIVFHAGTLAEGGKILANGGRVLNVTARAPSVLIAKKRAYEAVSKILWPDGFYRSDIGWRAIEG